MHGRSSTRRGAAWGQLAALQVAAPLAALDLPYLTRKLGCGGLRCVITAAIVLPCGAFKPSYAPETTERDAAEASVALHSVPPRHPPLDLPVCSRRRSRYCWAAAGGLVSA